MSVSRSTRSPSPHIIPFPRTAIPLPHNKHLQDTFDKARKKINYRAAFYAYHGRLDPKYPSHRNLMSVRLMEKLCWDSPFCSTVFSEELKDRSGQRYTIKDGQRKFEDQKAFETDIRLPLLDMRLEIAALEKARGGERLREIFVPVPKVNKIEGRYGEYIPSKPTFPAKPPSSPVRKKQSTLLFTQPLRRFEKLRIRKHWSAVNIVEKGSDDDEEMTDLWEIN